MSDIYQSTLPSIDGFTITATRGVVYANRVFGTNAIKDLGATIKNVLGGQIHGYQDTYSAGDAEVLAELAAKAAALGANAVLNIRLEHGAVGTKEGILTVLAHGTAVVATRSAAT